MRAETYTITLPPPVRKPWLTHLVGGNNGILGTVASSARRAVPALLYISIPNTHAELYGVIDRVLDDVDVL